MSILGRFRSILRGFLRAGLVFVSSGVIGYGIWVLMLVFSGGRDEYLSVQGFHIEITTSVGAFLGGQVSGYLWGRFFARRDYEKHRRMMEDIGVDVFDNR